MFASERQSKIKEILIEYKHVDVNTLCSLLDCSLATVRRDLDKLEEENFLIREHGGAILNEDSDNFTINLQGEADPYRDDKRAVADISASLVQDYDTIFIGPGYTCEEFAKAISRKKGLYIITNCLRVASILSTASDFYITVLGGTTESVNSDSSYTIGSTAISQLSNLFIQKAFITVQGISTDFGFSVNSPNICELYKYIFSHAENHYVMADSSKFGKRSMVRLAGPMDIQNIITNVEISNEYKDYFFTHKVALYTTFDEKNL